MGKAVEKSARPDVVQAELDRINKFLTEQIVPHHSKEENVEIREALIEDLQAE